MLECKICNKKYKNMCNLSKHIGMFHKELTKEEYYNRYISDNKNNGICSNKSCNNKTVFDGLSKGYRKFCSLTCSDKSEETKEKRRNTYLCRYGSKNIEILNKIKQTNLERYGTEYSLQNEIIREKIKKTNLERYGYECVFNNQKTKEKIKFINIEKYGCEHPSQTEEIKSKIKKTNLQRYGTECVLQNKEIKEKIKQINLDRYGTQYPIQNEFIREKAEKTNLKKYGYTRPAKNKDIYNKVIQTNLQKYGTKYVLQNKEVKDKSKLTCLKRYGTEYANQNETIKDKIKKTNLERYGYECTLQSKIIRKKINKTILESTFKKLLDSDRLKNLVKPNFKLEDYNGFKYKYSWICTKCGNVFEDNLDNGKIPRCLICFPLLIGHSIREKEIYNFVKNYFPDSVANIRSILSNRCELDIYIPSKNLAIEFNGLHWHSELQGKDKNYHLNKTLQCQEKGIQLIHIFEDEWLNNREIIESILKSKLNLIINKIPARKCTINPVNREEAFNFLDSNHLQGFINGTHLGLFYNNELVSILTYGKPRFNKKYEVEILRFCNKINTIVVGGLSKLLKRINSKSIITYVDRRYGTGKSYESVGFKLVGKSFPSYYYTKKNDCIRYNRLQFQKHLLESKLESFDPSLTEWQNMQLNGYDRIWDCGNLVYVRN